jgi:hypothetical protein
MKAIILSIALVTLTISCDTNSYDTPTNYDCERPISIPDTMCAGTEIYWDCSWNTSYLAGNVIVALDDSCGCVRYLDRITKNN